MIINRKCLFVFFLLLITFIGIVGIYGVLNTQKTVNVYSAYGTPTDISEALYSVGKILEKEGVATNRSIDLYAANFSDAPVMDIKNKNHINILWLGSSNTLHVEQIKGFDIILASTMDLMSYLNAFHIKSIFFPVFVENKDYSASWCAQNKGEGNDCFWVIIGEQKSFEQQLIKRNYPFHKYSLIDRRVEDILMNNINHITGIAVGNARLMDNSLDLAPFFIKASLHEIPIVTHTPDASNDYNYPLTVFNDHIFYYLHQEDIFSFFKEFNGHSGKDAAKFARDYLTENVAVERIKAALTNKEFQFKPQNYKITFEVPAKMGDITIGDYALAKDLKMSFKKKNWFAETVFTASLLRYTGIVNVYFRGATSISKDVKTKDKIFINWLLYPYYSPQQEILALEDYIKIMQDEFHYSDVIASASQIIANILQQQGFKAYYIPQFTNTSKFYPDYREELKTDVLFVGTNTWYRRAAPILLKHHLPIVIYGPRWNEGVAKAPYIANDELGKYYSSAKIVLSDARPDMLAYGFISNRIFDATACGTLVISDYMKEIEDVYGDSIPMWRTEEELVELVKYYLAPEHEAERLEKANRAHDITLKNFTADVVYDKFMDIINEVKKEKGLD